MEKMRHDADLLPDVRSKVIKLLDGFHRDSQLTYDIQGMRDEGTDILVRLHGPSGATRFLCIQVKSHVELAKESVAGTLLLQYSRTEDAYAPLAYFVVLAANMLAKPQQKSVRAIQSAFKQKAGVIVVDPQYTATFLSLKSGQMDALLTDIYRSGDPVTEEARSELSRMRPAEVVLALTVAARYLDNGDWPSIDELRQADYFARFLCGRAGRLHIDEEDYSKVLRITARIVDSAVFEQRLYKLMEATEEVDCVNGYVRLPVNQHRALYCLLAEASVKYDEYGDGLVEYALNLIFPVSAQ
jgi:hypothetical protein